MPIRYFPETNAIAKWGSIIGDIDEQIDLANKLNNKAPILHLSDLDNPHNVTKAQIGLGNVTDDAQLKRSANDFNSFNEKTIASVNDILLIEDSDNNYVKKKIKISSISNGNSGGGSGASYWLDANATVMGSDSFYFSGTEQQRYEIIDSFFICESSDSSVTRRGIIKNATYNNGIISVYCISDSSLASGDKNFKITTFIKSQEYSYYITIPGELVADSNNRQGTFYFARYNSYILVVDTRLITAATGSASVSWNLYKGTTALFNTAPDFGTGTALLDQVPNTTTVNAGDLISLRILTSSGTTRAAHLKLQFVMVPQFLLYKL